VCKSAWQGHTLLARAEWQVRSCCCWCCSQQQAVHLQAPLPPLPPPGIQHVQLNPSAAAGTSSLPIGQVTAESLSGHSSLDANRDSDAQLAEPITVTVTVLSSQEAGLILQGSVAYGPLCKCYCGVRGLPLWRPADTHHLRCCSCRALGLSVLSTAAAAAAVESPQEEPGRLCHNSGHGPGHNPDQECCYQAACGTCCCCCSKPLARLQYTGTDFSVNVTLSVTE